MKKLCLIFIFIITVLFYNQNVFSSDVPLSTVNRITVKVNTQLGQEHQFIKKVLKNTFYKNEEMRTILESLNILLIDDPIYYGNPTYKVLNESVYHEFPKQVYKHQYLLICFLQDDYNKYIYSDLHDKAKEEYHVKLKIYYDEAAKYAVKYEACMKEWRKEKGYDENTYSYKDKDGVWHTPNFSDKIGPRPQYPDYPWRIKISNSKYTLNNSEYIEDFGKNGPPMPEQAEDEENEEDESD